MIHSSTAIPKKSIRLHYELATLFYRLLWGPHVHHGLWESNESPRRAQLRLTEHLASKAGVAKGERALDVGCGMGGSSIHLATMGCHVTGVTLSQVQGTWARLSAILQGQRQRTRFLRADAETLEVAPECFDVVWSIECTEHLVDKAAFFQRAATWLRPGGRVAVCAWLAGDEPHTEADLQLVRKVCDAFLCPSLGTEADYCRWMKEAGLQLVDVENLTDRVKQTWDICERRIRRTGMPLLARCFGKEMREFIEHFMTIRQAYETGAMKYGSFLAQKR